jgi:hypothetical protein
MRALRFAALAPIALAVAACGGGATSLDAVANAATKTQAAATARFALEMRVTDPKNADENLSFRGPGEVAQHGRVMHMRVTMPGKAIDSDLGPGDVTFDMLALPGAYYYRGGPFGDVLPKGKTWLKIRAKDSPLDQLGQNDPSQMVEYLRAVSDLDELGEEEIRGVQTTHYSAKIQLDKMADRLEPKDAQRLQAMLRGAAITEIPLEAWIGDDGYVHRITMNWHVAGGSVVLSMEMFGFGEPVELPTPRPRDVVDLKKLLGG